MWCYMQLENNIGYVYLYICYLIYLLIDIRYNPAILIDEETYRTN